MHKQVLAVLLGLMLVMAGPGQAREIIMIAPIIPPHFDDQGKGRIGDIIAAVISHCGHSVSYRMVPFGRHWADYKAGKFDALATAEADQKFSGFTTKPFIHLQDGATVLVGSGLENAIFVDNFFWQTNYQFSSGTKNTRYRTTGSEFRQL